MNRARAIGLLLKCMAATFCATALCQGIPLASNRTGYEREVETIWSKTDEAARGKKLAELDAWLRRLPGRYTIDGAVTEPASEGLLNAGVQGIADCVFVGSGPGVQCIIHASWRKHYNANEVYQSLFSEKFSTMQPMMMLFGVDLDRGGIQLMKVDGTARDYLGLNDREPRPSGVCRTDDRTCVKFLNENNCSPALTLCWNRVYVIAKPESSRVLMTLLLPPGRVELRLSRVIQGAVPEQKKNR